MLRKLAAVALATSAVAVAAPAAAQSDAADRGGRTMGLRLETHVGSTFNLVGPGVTNGRTLDTTPGGDLRIGYDLPMGLTPVVGIGYRNISRTEGRAGGAEDDTSLGGFVIGIELRYYLAPHRANVTLPFVFAEYNTLFASVDGGDALNSDGEEFAADEVDYGNLNFGLGMEYKFAQGFAIGGKWGIGFGFTGAENPRDEDIFDSETTWGTSTSLYAAWRI